MSGAHAALSPYGDLVVPDITLAQLLSDTTSAPVPGRTDADTPILVPHRTRNPPGSPPPDAAPRLALPDTRSGLSVNAVRDLSTRIAVSLLAPPNTHFPSGQAGAALSALLSQPWPRTGVVALFSTNQHDFTTVALGLQVAGAIPALCNPAAKPSEFAHQLLRTGTRLIIATTSTFDTATEAARLASDRNSGLNFHSLAPLPSPPPVLVFEEDSEWSYARFLLRPSEAAWSRRGQLLASVSINPQLDDALYCFSSGTSGLPKAMRISHRNLVANVLQLYVLMADDFYAPLAQTYAPQLKPWPQSALPKGSSAGSIDSWVPAHPAQRHFHLDILPTFHAYGLVSQFVALYTGTPRVVFTRFHLDSFLQTVQDRQVTFSYVVPPILLALAQHPSVDEYDVSSLNHVASGAAPLPEQIVAQVKQRIGTVVTDGWGLSEMSPIVALQNMGVAAHQPGGVGNLGPGTGARVVNLDTGKDEAAGTEGEVYVRGPQMMLGYIGGDAVQATFEGAREAADAGDPLTPGAWLKTGDIGCIDQGTSVASSDWSQQALRRGQIRLTSRVKDVIKMNGFQVSPKELEDHLFDSQYVSDAAVVGLRRSTAEKRAKREASGLDKAAAQRESGPAGHAPAGLDALVDEVPWAFVVPSAHAREADLRMRTTELLKEVNGQVAGYKKLHGIEWVDSLPKSSSGKILKRQLRDDAEQSA